MSLKQPLRYWTVLLFTALISSGSPAPAEAKKLMFGTQDNLTRLQEVNIKGPQGEQLHLAHKYSFHSFLAPYWIEDGGYVLAVTGGHAYFKLSTEEIERLQARGRLTKPLPPYQLSPFDYLIGFLLWWIVAGIAVTAMLGAWLNKRRAPASAAHPKRT